MIAFANLQGVISEKSVTFPGLKAITALITLGLIGLIGVILMNPVAQTPFVVLICSALLLGILLVIPIGGADMPVIISLLNSYSGLAATATGFVLNNNVLIISGSLVGASGLILTKIMCKAMNRSLANDLFGGAISDTGERASNADADFYKGKIKSYGVEEAALLFESVQSAIIIPGYGMAVAQAQHLTKDFANTLIEQGVRVRYAIHPVAGRMPGHMNVLLAEADVPYDQLVEMDRINPDFIETDVASVLGANDVTNPSAREDKTSPIYGMPILDVDKARTVIVIKRSLSPGFAGIPNKLFINENTVMLFGDAKEVLHGLLNAMKD